jgi:hypothetical protein
MDVGGEVPGRFGIGIAPQHADSHFDAGEFLALDFDGIDARDQAYGLVGDQVAVQVAADFIGAAAFCVAIIIGDQVAQGCRIARFRSRLGFSDERADLVLGRTARSAGGAEPRRRNKAARRAQDKRPTPAVRR